METLTCQIILVSVFTISCTSKVLSFSTFENSIHNFFGRIRYAQSIAIIVIIAELITAIAIAFLQFSEAGLWIALLLLVVFTGLIILNLTRGRNFPCSCFGNASSNPISWWDVGRNFVFSILAIYLLIAHEKDTSYPLSLILTWAALFTLVWFIGIKLIPRLRSSAPRSNQRIELNLSVGKKPFPKIEMSDGLVSIDNFLSRRKPIALFILDFQFTTCLRVFNNVMNHLNTLKDLFTVVLIGKNVPREIVELSSRQAFDVVSQVEYNVSDFFGVTGVPSLVVVNETGELLSRLTGESALVAALSSGDLASLLTSAGALEDGYFKKVSNSNLADLVMYDQKERLISFSGSKESKLLVFWSPYCSACGGVLEDIVRLNNGNSLSRIVLITPADHKAIENFDSIVIDKDFVVGKKLNITGTPSAILHLPGSHTSEAYLAVGKENIAHLISQLPAMTGTSTLRSKIYETIN